MTSKRNYAALKQTLVFEVAGSEIEIRKTGSIALIEKLTKSPILEPFVAKLGDMQIAGRKVGGEEIKAEFAAVAHANGLSGADLVLRLPKILRDLVDDLIVDSAVVEDEAQREALRELVGEFNEQDLFFCIAAFLKLNFPSAYGPFARMGEALLAPRPHSSESVENVASSTTDGSELAKAA